MYHRMNHATFFGYRAIIQIRYLHREMTMIFALSGVHSTFVLFHRGKSDLPIQCMNLQSLDHQRIPMLGYYPHYRVSGRIVS